MNKSNRSRGVEFFLVAVFSDGHTPRTSSIDKIGLGRFSGCPNIQHLGDVGMVHERQRLSLGLLARLKDLDKQGIAATSDVDEARAAAEAAQARLDTVIARLDDRLIRAPFSGMLGFREVSPGTLLMSGNASHNAR